MIYITVLLRIWGKREEGMKGRFCKSATIGRNIIEIGSDEGKKEEA